MSPLRKMRRRSVLILVSLGLALSAGCLFLIFKSYNQASERHSQVLDFFGRAKDLDHLLDEDVLLTRSFLLSSYDSLDGVMKEMTKLCEDVGGSQGFWAENAEFLAATGPEYCQSVRKKLALVEEFKANNSLLRASRTSIPNLVSRFQDTPFDEDSDHLLIAIFRYFLNETSENYRAVKMGARWTKDAEKDPKFVEAARDMRQNVESILMSLRNRTRLEDEIFSGAVRVRYSNLETTYRENYARAEKRSVRYRIALLALSGILAAGLVWFVYRLNLWKEALSDLNRTLEDKVKERTSALLLASEEIAQNQQMLSQSAKMSAIGEMAGGIAHEINTPLAAILLYSESLKKNAEKEGVTECVKVCENIISTVERISKIVAGLRRFSRNATVERPRPARVADVVEDALILCREKFKNHGVSLKVVGADAPVFAECVADQVSQAVLNLLNNAFDAISPLPEKWVRIEIAEIGETCEISVTDSGGGIPPSVQAKLMQPFFTTKGIGKGTGLGLSISKGLLEAQGGELVYDSKSPNTRFVIRLRCFDEYRIA